MSRNLRDGELLWKPERNQVVDVCPSCGMLALLFEDLCAGCRWKALKA